MSDRLPLNYPCPACGFKVFDHLPGSAAVCPTCAWKDDHVQLKFPGLAGGANKESLCSYQQEALKKLPPELAVFAGYSRDADWRPLNPAECVLSGDAPQTSEEFFWASSEDIPPYYWKE